MTQFDKQPDEIENLGTKIIITQEGCQKWFGNRMNQELTKLYSLSINNLSVQAGSFILYIDDLHVVDIQLPDPVLEIDEENIIVSYENANGTAAFNYKIQQQIYPYIQINSQAQVYAKLSGIVYSQGYINKSCPNFIYTKNNQAKLNMDNFQINLNMNNEASALLQGMVQLLNNQIINLLTNISTQFINKCFDYAYKIASNSTRFSLAEQSDLLLTDLRYLYLQNHKNFIEIQLPGNICVKNGTTKYENNTVVICKGWYMQNKKLIQYQTNDNLQYLMSRFQFQGIFDSLKENNLLNYTLKNQQIKQITIDQIVNTGVIISVYTSEKSYKFLANIDTSHSQQSWKVTTLIVYLQIIQELESQELNQQEINELNQLIGLYGVGYQDASYINYQTLYPVFIDNDWLLISTNFTYQ